MTYNEILRYFPRRISTSLEEVFKQTNYVIEEIRLRTERPIIIKHSKGEEILKTTVSINEILETLQHICDNSIYTYQNQICNGFVTIKGGHRIGLAGECVISNGEVRTIKNISSLNIRISREVVGSSDKVMKLITNNNRVYNTLIVSPPKCGKTTILRDIARNISNGMHKISLSGKKVVIVDERSEIAACYNGIPQMNVGIRADILDNCLKKSGMIMAIRSLSPEVLVCDEIGTKGDLEALNMAFNCGVNIIATVHGYDINDVYGRSVFKDLIDNCILERIILLSNRKGAGTIEKIYKVNREKGLQCLEI